MPPRPDRRSHHPQRAQPVATATRPAVANSTAPSPGAAAAAYLAFRLPDLACALPLAALREVVPVALLSRPPGMPSLLEGLLDLGGTAVPVVRLSRVFGVPDVTVGLYVPLLVLRHSEDRIALLVGAIDGIVRVPPARLRPVSSVTFNDCVMGQIDSGGWSFHLLDPDRLLLEKERQCLAEFQAAEQDRLRRVEEARP